MKTARAWPLSMLDFFGPKARNCNAARRSRSTSIGRAAHGAEAYQARLREAARRAECDLPRGLPL